MKHTYTIKGMTCGGCKASVEKYLSAIENVTNVSVNLEKGEADITMSHHIETKVFQSTLPEKYTFNEEIFFPNISRFVYYDLFQVKKLFKIMFKPDLYSMSF